MISEFEKSVYNTFLRIQRQSQQLPYNYRINFDEFEQEESYLPLKKVACFLENHKNVNVELFFRAPFNLYPGESFYIDFFNTPRAVKLYTIFLDGVLMEDPDSTQQLEYIVESFKYIKAFCASANIPVLEYISTSTANIAEFITHLAQRRVSIYALFAFCDFEKFLYSNERELLEFVLGSKFLNNIDMFRTKYMTSSKAKQLSQRCLEKIIKNS